MFRNLVDLLCCPTCRSDARAYPSVLTASGNIVEGTLHCDRCDVTIARISRGKYDFIHSDRNVPRADDALRLDGELATVHTPWNALGVVRNIGFEPYQGEAWFTQIASAEIAFRWEGVQIGFVMLTHPWSGIVEVSVDDGPWEEIDLYGEASVTKTFWIGSARNEASHTATVRATGRARAEALGTQTFIHGAYTITTQSGAIEEPVNRGTPFPTAYRELLDLVPSDGYVLDCGGGDRSLADPRVVNFEYLPYDAPDVYGDGHHMPFKDGAFDVVLSQAVLEHMEDPIQAGKEIARVLKPGGIVYAEVAFMQPLHAVPFHFFNHTVWGIEKVFSMLRKIKTDWAGGITDSVRWYLNVANAETKLLESERIALYAILSRIDASMSHDDLKPIASFVKHWAIKEGDLTHVGTTAEATLLP